MAAAAPVGMFAFQILGVFMSFWSVMKLRFIIFKNGTFYFIQFIWRRCETSTEQKPLVQAHKKMLTFCSNTYTSKILHFKAHANATLWCCYGDASWNNQCCHFGDFLAKSGDFSNHFLIKSHRFSPIRGQQDNKAREFQKDKKIKERNPLTFDLSMFKGALSQSHFLNKNSVTCLLQLVAAVRTPVRSQVSSRSPNTWDGLETVRRGLVRIQSANNQSKSHFIWRI